MEYCASSDRNVSSDLSQDSAGTSILDLNQHCLLQVFNHLDVYDAINFGETCKMLQVVSRLAMIKYKDFDLIADRMYRNGFITSPSGAAPVPFEKVLSFVAPYMESLDARIELVERHDFSSRRYNADYMRQSAEPLHTLLQFDMPKLKSLTVQNSDHLVYIVDRRSINKLTIYDIHPNGLNTYASGLRNLTQLHLICIHKEVALEEISVILENNPTIEDLCLVFEVTSMVRDLQQPEIPASFIQKLPRLKRLALSIRSNASEIWKSMLQIQQLSELALVMREQVVNDTLPLSQFLKELAKKNTVRSIELKGVLFGGDDDSCLFDALASMNLNSLCIEPSSIPSKFYSTSTSRTKFQTLMNLRLHVLAGIDEMMLIIKRFESLKRLEFRIMVPSLESCSSTLSQRISQLLPVTPTTRPDLEVEIFSVRALIKISFRHGTYEIISWPEPSKCPTETHEFSCSTQ